MANWVKSIEAWFGWIDWLSMLVCWLIEVVYVQFHEIWLDPFFPKFCVGQSWKIWVNLILSMFDEIGWFRMLKVCLIEDWLDQFDEN